MAPRPVQGRRRRKVNTPAATGFARAVPLDGKPRHPGAPPPWSHDWKVIDCRNGKTIAERPAPQRDNLAAAIKDPTWLSPQGAAEALAGELNAVVVGFECPRCRDSGLEPDREAEGDPPTCKACKGEPEAPSTAMLCTEARRLRIAGKVA